MRARLAAGLAVLLVLVTACGLEQPVGCAACSSKEPAPGLTFAVFGDFPYSPTQQRQLPQLVSQLNADLPVSLVFHVGDIRDVGTCNTAYYHKIKATFEALRPPLVYTFGDNEWADCSKSENGGYDPLERLAMLRRTFFATPGQALGGSLPVSSEAELGLPENVWFVKDDLSFAVFHAVGDNNDLEPWAGQTAPISQQRADTEHRVSGAETVIGDAFDAARTKDSRAVVLLTHADMFAGPADPGKTRAFGPIVAKIARESADFAGRVYLINGDSHTYQEDQPLGAKSVWPAAYDVKPVENLTRITVDGGPNARDYLRVTAEPYYLPVLSWTRTPFIGQPAQR